MNVFNHVGDFVPVHIQAHKFELGVMYHPD